MSTLVLIRHGESEWNAEGLFTGWVDVGLSEAGVREAVAGGTLLRDHGLAPQIVHTSVLTRAIQTANLALEAAGLLWLPVARSWRLNERHYGALQGKNKAQTRHEFGDEQFMVWRRSYDVPPPPLPDDHPLSQAGDPRYAHLPPELLPRTECLADVLHRMLPYWYDAIVPDLAADRTVLVVAHGNSLRALVLPGVPVPRLDHPRLDPHLGRRRAEHAPAPARHHLAERQGMDRRARAVPPRPRRRRGGQGHPALPAG